MPHLPGYSTNPWLVMWFRFSCSFLPLERIALVGGRWLTRLQSSRCVEDGTPVVNAQLCGVPGIIDSCVASSLPMVIVVVVAGSLYVCVWSESCCDFWDERDDAVKSEKWMPENAWAFASISKPSLPPATSGAQLRHRWQMNWNTVTSTSLAREVPCRHHRHIHDSCWGKIYFSTCNAIDIRLP